MQVNTQIVFLGLGSNLGDRAAYIQEALIKMNCPDFSIRGLSSIYESSPWGPVQDQPFFYNAVAKVHTNKAAFDILQWCQKTEISMGRQKKKDKGPRNIDIDVLLIGNLVINKLDFIVPHPGLSQRIFVLEPLMELEPNLIDPRDGSCLMDYLKKIRSTQMATCLGHLVHI